MLGLSTCEKLVKLEHQCNEAYQAYRNRVSAPLNAPPVQLKHMHFTQRIADLRWVRLAGQAKHSETPSASTENYPHAFPIEESRSLPEIGAIFGFKDCRDVDHNGKNLFYHLFTAMTYCYGITLICEEAFAQGAPRLSGNYAPAMSQHVTSGQQLGHTPLHVLCEGSDIAFDKLAIVKLLIENNIVDSRAFATLNDNEVTV